MRNAAESEMPAPDRAGATERRSAYSPESKCLGNLVAKVERVVLRVFVLNFRYLLEFSNPQILKSSNLRFLIH